MQIDPKGAPPMRAPARTLAAAPLASTQGEPLQLSLR